jgi:hypothetical protein
MEGFVPGSSAMQGFGIIAVEFTAPLQVTSNGKISSIYQEEVLLTQELFFLPFSINGL